VKKKDRKAITPIRTIIEGPPAVTAEQAADNFFESRNFKPSTEKHRRNMLKTFFVWHDKNRHLPLDNYTTLVAFGNHLETLPIKPVTYNIKMAAARDLLKFLGARESDLDIMISPDQEAENQLVKSPGMLSDIDISRCLGYHWRGFYDLRNRAMIGLMIDSGMRMNEVITLRMDDIVLSTRSIRTFARFVTFSPRTREKVEDYLREEDPKKPNDHVFDISHDGLKSVLAEMFNSLEIECGPEDKPFRRALSNKMFFEGIDIEIIAKYLHENEQTIMQEFINPTPQNYRRIFDGVVWTVESKAASGPSTLEKTGAALNLLRSKKS
jgi:site-specific recombinase XerD